MAATAREFASSPIRPPAKLAPLEGRRYVLRPMAALRSKQTCGAYHRSRRPGRKYSLLSHRAFHQVRLDDRQFARSRRRTDTMLNKTNQIRAAWAAGDRTGALRIAARFFDRSNATKTFKRGMDAHNHPEFYQQLGKKPEQSRLRCLQGGSVCIDRSFRPRDARNRHNVAQKLMSALPPKADIRPLSWDVRFGPQADMCIAAQIRCVGHSAEARSLEGPRILRSQPS
jgi:hypothetical protein